MLIPHTSQTPGHWSGGTTQTIYLYPIEADLGTGDYLFWINIATIEQEATYSYFPNYQRLHLILSSSGLHLHFNQPSQIVELSQFDTYLFDGGRPLRAEPVDSPVTAFNIIMKTGLTATVQQIDFSQESILLADLLGGVDEPKKTFYLFYSVTGQIEITSDETKTLNPGDAYLIAPENRAKMFANQAQLQISSDNVRALMARIILPTKT